MQPVELVIKLTPTGQVTVTGPIEQRLLCYGLLEVARDVIGAHNPTEQRIVPPPAGGLSMIKGNGHGL
jgi:hypothetical protein